MNIPRSTSSVSRPSSEASTAPTPAVLSSTSGATTASYVPGIASRHAASGRGSEHPSGGGGGREDGQTHDVHAPVHARLRAFAGDRDAAAGHDERAPPVVGL